MQFLSFVPGVILVVVVLCGTGFTAGVGFSGTDYSTQSVGSVVSADLNRDGLPDMAIAGEAMISLFLATGPGKFGAKADYPIPAAPSALRNLLAADFDGDGALDLIIGSPSVSQLFILWNNGDGTFRNGPTLKLSAPASSFDLGDFNHDGLLDMATVECTSSSIISCSMNVYQGKGSGAFTKLRSVKLSGPANQVSVADINGDGNPDLAISRTTQVLLWWGKGDGTFSAPSRLTPTGQTDEVGSFAIADFNNDGKLDVAVNTGTNLSLMGCLSGSSWFFKNTGGNNFSLLWTSPGGCSDLDPVDMNGDLNEDLIYQNGHPDAGFFVGFLGNGNGTLGKSFSYPSFPNQVGGALYVRKNLRSCFKLPLRVSGAGAGLGQFARRRHSIAGVG
jgi:hypothetical protein